MENIETSLRIKIRKPNGEIKSIKRTEPVKALKTFDEYTSPEFSVLGIPFGGPVEGRDSDGEAFHKGTDIMLNVGDTRPVTYYHGYGPDDPYEWQEQPVVIGMAKLASVSKKGYMFDVRLDPTEPLAQRIIANPAGAKSSSGAVGHLVRVGKAGLIDIWPLGELALFDTNEWRLPANDYAVVTAKTSQPEAEVEAEQVKTEAAQCPSITQTTINKDIKKMENEIEVPEVKPEVKTPDFDYSKMAEALKPTIENAVSAKFEALVNEEPEIKATPAVKKVSQVGFAGDVKAGFLHWMKTGQKNSMLKADLQEGDATEGGYLVPEDFVPQIFEKADERSVAVRAGAMVITTSLDVVNIPIEGTQASWSLTSEESSYGTSALEFDQVSATVYKSTVSPKISEELLADNKTNLESWLIGKLGRRFAVHENLYTIAGTGSTQPQGVLYGGTAGLTFDDTNTIAVGEIPELMGKLKEAYQLGANFTMERATFFYLQGLTGNQFQLWQPNMGVPLDARGNNADGVLMNKPVFFSDAMGSYTTTAHQSVVYGDWSMYALVRNSNITVLRNPYLYGATGQVVFHFKTRWGGVVTQAEAFQIGRQA